MVDYLNLPPAAVNGGRITSKFVLIAWRETLWFVMGRVAEFEYHADLVDRFCTDNHIASGWAKRPDLVEILDPAARLRGGGWLDINNDRRQCTIFGHSTSYGRFERVDIDQVLAEQNFFAAYQNRIA